MSFANIALLAGGLVLFALVSRRIERLPVTMPMVFVLLGIITDAAGWIELRLSEEGVVLLGEAALAVILFSDAVRIDITALRKDSGLPLRLLGIGLPVSVFMGVFAIAAILPVLDIWEAALVAAILAPTDAALGQAVIEQQSVPLRIRQGLNVESGLNDGLALPAVLLFAQVAKGLDAEVDIMRLVFEEVGLAVVLGVTLGAAIAWLMNLSNAARWVQDGYAQLATLAIAVLTYSTAEWLDANGFVAVFIAGLAYGEIGEYAEHNDEYAETTGRLLAMATFFVFGNIFVSDALDVLSARVVLCAVMALTVGRMVPVAIALLGSGANWRTVLFCGWFGPRGLASILFGLLIVEDGLVGAEELFGIITWTVLGSVMLHGATASWLAEKYGAWFASMENAHEMPEGGPTSVHPVTARMSDPRRD